jgi:hypothetical protein
VVAGHPYDAAHQWAASFGGPLKRNKLFFFFDTEGLRLLIPQPTFVTIPSPQFEAATLANIDSRFGLTSASDAFYRQIFGLYNAALGASPVSPGANPNDRIGCTGFPGLGAGVPCARYFLSTRGRASDDTLASARVDWTVGRNDRTFLRLQYDRSRAAVYTDPISSVFDADVSGPWWQGQLIETHSFGSSAASQFLLAGFFHSADSQSVSAPVKRPAVWHNSERLGNRSAGSLDSFTSMYHSAQHVSDA